MKNRSVETILRDWFKEMVSRYRWLTIKFEYSEKRGVYLVSYSPAVDICSNDDFMSESMAFEDKMNALYGDDAPLFCDEEKYFKLSDNAETIKYVKTEVVRLSFSKTNRSWNFSSNISTKVCRNISYPLAA